MSILTKRTTNMSNHFKIGQFVVNKYGIRARVVAVNGDFITVYYFQSNRATVVRPAAEFKPL